MEIVKIKKKRNISREIQTRNEFIYNHRYLPMKELTSLITKNFGIILDYTYIQTIIRREKEKRN